MQSEIVPRPEQVRAARSLIGWSQHELATRAGVAVSVSYTHLTLPTNREV